MGTREEDQLHEQLDQFPPPPSFYKLYAPRSDQDKDHPLPPGPPPPIEGEYEQYGELHTVNTLGLLGPSFTPPLLMPLSR